MSKRIAIVFRGIGDIGGSNNTIAEHARRLTALGHRVDLIGQQLHRRPIPADLGRPVNVPRLPLLRRYRWPWFFRQAERRLRRGRYDFVAGHGHHWTQDVLSLHLCMYLDHEMVHGQPLSDPDPLARLHDRLLRQRPFTLCIANSGLMRRDLVARYGLPEERIRVVYPGYDPERFNLGSRQGNRAAVRRELGIEQAFVLGFVTSGDFHKRGLDILFQAVEALPRRLRSGVVLLVLGKTGGAERLLRSAAGSELGAQLRLVPPTRQPERYFQAMDLCVHPARFETFGQSVQEAMACGLPVVTSRRVGVAELLPPSVYEQLPEAPTAESIAHQIERLMDSELLRHELAEAGRLAVAGNTHERNFGATLAVYREAGL